MFYNQVQNYFRKEEMFFLTSGTYCDRSDCKNVRLTKLKGIKRIPFGEFHPDNPRRQHAGSMKMAAFWDVAPCSLLDTDREVSQQLTTSVVSVTICSASAVFKYFNCLTFSNDLLTDFTLRFCHKF
jgi:hypothetical protein